MCLFNPLRTVSAADYPVGTLAATVLSDKEHHSNLNELSEVVEADGHIKGRRVFKALWSESADTLEELEDSYPSCDYEGVEFPTWGPDGVVHAIAIPGTPEHDRLGTILMAAIIGAPVEKLTEMFWDE